MASVSSVGSLGSTGGGSNASGGGGGGGGGLNLSQVLLRSSAGGSAASSGAGSSSLGGMNIGGVGMSGGGGMSLGGGMEELLPLVLQLTKPEQVCGWLFSLKGFFIRNGRFSYCTSLTNDMIFSRYPHSSFSLASLFVTCNTQHTTTTASY
jgi:hypothetical protein